MTALDRGSQNVGDDGGEYGEEGWGGLWYRQRQRRPGEIDYGLMASLVSCLLKTHKHSSQPSHMLQQAKGAILVDNHSAIIENFFLNAKAHLYYYRFSCQVFRR